MILLATGVLGLLAEEPGSEDVSFSDVLGGDWASLSVQMEFDGGDHYLKFDRLILERRADGGAAILVAARKSRRKEPVKRGVLTQDELHAFVLKLIPLCVAAQHEDSGETDMRVLRERFSPEEIARMFSMGFPWAGYEMTVVARDGSTKEFATRFDLRQQTFEKMFALIEEMTKAESR